MTRQPDKSYEPFERKSKIFFMSSKLVFDTMSNKGFFWTGDVVAVDDEIVEESKLKKKDLFFS